VARPQECPSLFVGVTWYADPLRSRTLKQSGKAVIRPSRHYVPDEG